ncbi:hypothetical protein Y032_0007g3440 [Ancylostoma ceylanicum]|uniref:Uncharacterized protein n=1 Tax=Ancylostoma ceylanicum TaxID=53326 RepID=A0A016VMG5_9BILA|nr:hypothetical protein Y032_0007g3440 [Ancylostoma ceylanicum]
MGTRLCQSLIIQGSMLSVSSFSFFLESSWTALHSSSKSSSVCSNFANVSSYGDDLSAASKSTRRDRDARAVTLSGTTN